MSGYIALVVRMRSGILVAGIGAAVMLSVRVDFLGVHFKLVTNRPSDPNSPRILPRKFPRSRHPNAFKKCSTSNGSSPVQDRQGVEERADHFSRHLRSCTDPPSMGTKTGGPRLYT